MSNYENHSLCIKDIPNSWNVAKNEWRNVSLSEAIAQDEFYTYFSEDLIQVTNSKYKLDLGWYGEEDGQYVIYLFDGHDWNESPCLLKFESKDQEEVRAKFSQLLAQYSEVL
ncbi:hypothetical protein K6119_08120 [Paracrocinitomix mangrovi]|uniref:hypothetical protein n=1 Tax=Paracrocinitomix mangrovi TaxID=2862509 RepID=UPI001C8D5863|nr:hypothetical protein [Paracrocinitomix mangrovi]UKN03478.1 hypothetical protein K6119_08120 [Paracrocinitomix mangrovi]